MAVKYQLLDSNSPRPVSTSLLSFFRLYQCQSCICLLLLVVLVFYYTTQFNFTNIRIFSSNDEKSNKAKIDQMQSFIDRLWAELDEKTKELETLKSNHDQQGKQEQANRQIISFRRRAETHIDCGRILSNDKIYIKQFGGNNRIKMRPSAEIDMSCVAISNRILPSKKPRRLKFGVAFARIVYKDYEFIEDELRSSFHPQNSFCFAIDKKSPFAFQNKIRRLSKCFPNVYSSPEDYELNSGGHNINHAHYDCMRVLASNNTDWQYIVLLQNHDIVTKSVYELVEVFDILGGANDAELTRMPEGRIDRNFVWNAKNVKLFKDESKVAPEILNRSFSWGKGATQVSLSRAAVDWLTQTVDLSLLIAKIDANGYGADEELWQMLQVSDFLGMPGHFTDKCLQQGKTTDFITRMSQWIHNGPQECASGVNRHGICLLGVEDIPTLAAFPNIMFNKMMPDFDIVAIDCWHEVMFNRTHLGQDDHPLERSYYENMVNVLYHKHKNESDYKLNCMPNYTRWQRRKYPV